MPSTVLKTALNITINNMQDCPSCIHECTHVDSLDRRPFEKHAFPRSCVSGAPYNGFATRHASPMRSSQEQLEPPRDSRKTPGDGRERASSVGRPASGWERLRAARSDQREAGSGRRRLAEPGSELYRTIIEQLVIN